MNWNSITGTILKRNNQQKRYLEFVFSTAILLIKEKKTDLKPTKSIFANEIIDVRLLFDNPNDVGRAFSFTIRDMVFNLAATHAVEA